MQVAKERFALGGRHRWVGQNWHRGRAFWPLSQHGFCFKDRGAPVPIGILGDKPLVNERGVLDDGVHLMDVC